MNVDLTKYNIASKICGKVMKEIINNIKNKEMLNIIDLCNFGNRRINEECDNIYKKEKNKGVAFPTSISLNNCCGNYIYEESNGEEFNVIKNDDIIKIELGVNILGCIAILGETITTNDKTDSIIELLNDLQKDIIKMIKVGEINDEIRIHIESKCTDEDCFPVENCISYQQEDGHLNAQNSKYMILNYQKYYDKNEYLTVEENTCYEFEENDVFNINLTIIKDHEITESTHNYIENHDPHIYRLNDYFYNLKLKTSREFYSMIKSQHNNNAFDGREYFKNIRQRIGIKDSLNAGILTKYPILYSKDKLPVYHKKFTIVVGKEKSNMLKYN